MKILQFSLNGGIFALVLALSPAVEAQSGKRLSREELIERRDAAREASAELLPEEKAESQAHPSQSSILDRSVLLSNGRNWTFIPKGAVLYIPEKYQERVNVAEGRGKYIPFTQFAQKNRQWIQTYSVTLEQARGTDAISDKAREALAESGRVVITVCKGGPISTRKPKTTVAAAQN